MYSLERPALVLFWINALLRTAATAGRFTIGLVRAASGLFPIGDFTRPHIEIDFDIFAFGGGHDGALAGHAVRILTFIVFRIVATASHWLAP